MTVAWMTTITSIPIQDAGANRLYYAGARRISRKQSISVLNAPLSAFPG